MNPQPRSQVAAESAHALAKHLQLHPESVQETPQELAHRFGLEESFVSEVLSAVRPPEERPSAPVPPVKLVLRRFGHTFDGAFTRLTAHPQLFVFATAAVATGVGAYLQIRYGDQAELPSYAFNIQWTVVILMWCLQFAAYARYAMVRFALQSSLINWLVAAPVAMIIEWNSIKGSSLDYVVSDLLFHAGQDFVLYTQYGLIASVAAVAGAYIRQRRVEREEERMSRQELLERLFEIQGKLRDDHSHVAKPDAREVWVRRFRVNWPLKTFLVGLGFGIVQILVLMVAGGLDTGGTVTMASRLVYPVLFATDIVLLGLCGFLSGSMLRAVAAGFLYQAGTIVPMLIPVPGRALGPEFVLTRWAQPPQLVSLIATTLIAAVAAGLGAAVEERWQRVRRLRRDEPAALLAEMVRIQWRLAPHTADVCVMVVDVVRSSDMKALSDPLLVEYSFREYQHFVAELSARHNGTVHSTAGDGVVVAFPSCHEAMGAARAVLAGLDEFNREDNKLDLPFRVRIGIHVGPVAGELNMVQFTEVIDIAAHAQDVSAPGTIAVTEAVARHLGMAGLAELDQSVDGQRLFVLREAARDPSVPSSRSAEDANP